MAAISLKEKAVPWAGAAALALLGAGLLGYPAAVGEAVAQSALYCLTTLVPSLFPFMAAAGYGARSPAGEALGRLLSPVTRHLFRLPQAAGTTLLLAFAGGYPAGARGVSLLWERGRLTREQAARMMAFCVAPGPAFVVTFVGVSVLGSPRAGWLLLAAVTLSGLGLGVLAGLGKPLPPRQAPSSPREGGGALVASVGDACRATALMCGCVLLFAAGSGLARASGLWGGLCRLVAAADLCKPFQGEAVLGFLWEVTAGSAGAARLGAPGALFAFGLGFGGLCVHAQVFAFFREFPLGKRWFFLCRGLHGLGAAGLYLLLERLFPAPARLAWAASGGPAAFGGAAAGWAGGLSLALMSLAFLLAGPQPLRRGETCAIIPPEGKAPTTGRRRPRPWRGFGKRKSSPSLEGTCPPAAPTASTTGAPGTGWCAPCGGSQRGTPAKSTATTPFSESPSRPPP